MTQSPILCLKHDISPICCQKNEKPRVLVRLGIFHVLFLYHQFTQCPQKIIQIFQKFTESSQINFLLEAVLFSIRQKSVPTGLGHGFSEIRQVLASSCHPFYQ